MADYKGYTARHQPPAMATSEAKRVGDPTLSTCIEDLDPVIARAAEYAERLHHLADRVEGPQPAEHRQKGEEAHAPFLINALNQRRVRLVEALNELERALNRLGSSI